MWCNVVYYSCLGGHEEYIHDIVNTARNLITCFGSMLWLEGECVVGGHGREVWAGVYRSATHITRSLLSFLQCIHVYSINSLICKLMLMFPSRDIHVHDFASVKYVHLQVSKHQNQHVHLQMMEHLRRRKRMSK